MANKGNISIIAPFPADIKLGAVATKEGNAPCIAFVEGRPAETMVLYEKITESMYKMLRKGLPNDDAVFALILRAVMDGIEGTKKELKSTEEGEAS